MDEDYDIIVMGTGLKECILSGMMSVAGKKVLHIDRNNYYGGESASLAPLKAVFEHFGMGDQPMDMYGRGQDWSVDIIPKFLMANGLLVKLLIHTRVTRYIDFKQIDGSYVFREGKLYKVPATATEAFASSLMGIFEKRRFVKFLEFVNKFDEKRPETWDNKDPRQVTSEQVLAGFSLDKNTVDAVGHAFALYTDDRYLTQPYGDMVTRIKLYRDSLAAHGKTPYLYPQYGLGELPQGFSRLSAVHGGTFMLDRPCDEILYDADGKVRGIKSRGEEARCKMIICDPTYAKDQCNKVGQVVRAICLLDHPIPNTSNAQSCQIIIPQKQVNRQHDIYVASLSFANCVSANGWYIAILSTTVETANPQSELQPAMKLLGNVMQMFTWTSDLYDPTHDGVAKQLFISRSYDATSHFESTCRDVLDMYRRVTGEEFDFSKVKPLGDDE